MSVIKGITKEQLMDKINAYDRNKTSIVADLKNVTQWDVGLGKFEVTLDGKSYHFTPWAQNQFLRKLRIPRAYFDICSEDLRNQEIEEGIANLSRGSENRFKIYIDPESQEQNIYGFIPKSCRDILTGELAEKVLNGLGSKDGVIIDEAEIALDNLRVRFYDSTKPIADIAVDEEFPAVDFGMSEVLKTPIKLQSVLYRKVCSNGLVIPQEMNQSFVMPLTRFKPDVFDLNIQYVENSASRLDCITKTLNSLKSIELPQALIGAEADERNLFDDVFEYVLPARSLRGEFEQTIRAEYNQEGNFTANGIVNATTKIARDLETDSSKVQLETLAGQFVTRISMLENDHPIEYTKEMLDKTFKPKKKFSAVNA